MTAAINKDLGNKMDPNNNPGNNPNPDNNNYIIISDSESESRNHSRDESPKSSDNGRNSIISESPRNLNDNRETPNRPESPEASNNIVETRPNPLAERIKKVTELSICLDQKKAIRLTPLINQRDGDSFDYNPGFRDADKDMNGIRGLDPRYKPTMEDADSASKKYFDFITNWNRTHTGTRTILNEPNLNTLNLNKRELNYIRTCMMQDDRNSHNLDLRTKANLEFIQEEKACHHISYFDKTFLAEEIRRQR
jgi:hypothetical protein